MPFVINKHSKMASYKYLLTQDSENEWGIITKTVGVQQVPVGSPYPIGNHPEDYLFMTDKGRILCEYQILYIMKGEGWFVSNHQSRTRLSAGDVVILYPGEWHNYAPDTQTGWSEAWIGFTGNYAGKLLDKFRLYLKSPIHHVGMSEVLINAFDSVCQIAQDQLPAYQQQLMGFVWLIVSTVYAREQQMPYLDNPDQGNINAAIRYMRQHLNRNLAMEDVAKEAGMGYSKFRKMFRDYTGFAPAQYFLRLKMERAKDYLLSTNLSCKEISFRLGFDSASYFNKMFRLYQGTTPMSLRGRR